MHDAVHLYSGSLPKPFHNTEQYIHITIVHLSHTLLINAHPILVYHVNYDTELARIWAIVYQSNTPDLYKSFIYLFGNMYQ